MLFVRPLLNSSVAVLSTRAQDFFHPLNSRLLLFLSLMTKQLVKRRFSVRCPPRSETGFFKTFLKSLDFTSGPVIFESSMHAKVL